MKIAAYIEAGPVGTPVLSSWPGKPGNQVVKVWERDATLSGLREIARELHDRMGEVGRYALDAWLECDGRRVGYCELSYTDYREALRRLVSEG
jgi:hypothetical protein